MGSGLLLALAIVPPPGECTNREHVVTGRVRICHLGTGGAPMAQRWSRPQRSTPQPGISPPGQVSSRAFAQVVRSHPDWTPGEYKPARAPAPPPAGRRASGRPPSISPRQPLKCRQASSGDRSSSRSACCRARPGPLWHIARACANVCSRGRARCDDGLGDQYPASRGCRGDADRCRFVEMRSLRSLGSISRTTTLPTLPSSAPSRAGTCESRKRRVRR